MIAITRDVSPSLAACELSFVARSEIDLDRAIAQHEAYRHTLQTLGCRVVALEAQAELPDAVFVEDVAIVLDEVAILTRPGAVSRKVVMDAVGVSTRHPRSRSAPAT